MISRVESVPQTQGSAEESTQDAENPVTIEDLQAKLMGGVPMILDFTASWCGPCQTLGPRLKEIAKQYPQVEVYKVDVSQQNDDSDAVFDVFHVNCLPTLLFSNVVQEEPGVESTLETCLKRCLRTEGVHPEFENVNKALQQFVQFHGITPNPE